MLLQKNAQLIDESPLSMVFRLGFDVTPDSVLMAGADGECRITLLPCKMWAMLTRCPNRRGLLQLAQEVLYSVIGVETDKEMHVVFHAADGSGLGTQPAHGSSQVLVKMRAPSGAYEGMAFLRAENEVVVKRDV